MGYLCIASASWNWAVIVLGECLWGAWNHELVRALVAALESCFRHDAVVKMPVPLWSINVWTFKYLEKLGARYQAVVIRLI